MRMSGRLLAAFATAFGLSLVACAGTAPVASAASLSITGVAIRVAQTSDGTVSYRSDGSGPPLVLIMGFSGSQDTWSPGLVNALARRHRVITFDNAGIGHTAVPPGALTISAMADQTAALIKALHLRHPDVLGWSMGGMIAQALAVRHPGDVRRLVLCSTFSGNGKATLPSAANASALFNAASTNNVTELLSLIFPPDRLATVGPAYIQSITEYPGFYLAPPAVDTAQDVAIQRWAGGKERAGHGRVGMPTLIGDGADDVVTPPANAHKLAQAITGAKVVIYPDAGHGFLFQDANAWAARVNRFLG
jgi:pimeloyl-ACP methyl ester carboxylesterase